MTNVKLMVKKVIFVLMAAVMCMSIFTSVPYVLPEAQAASAGDYCVRVRWCVVDGNNLKNTFTGTCNDEEDSCGIYVKYKENNGTGAEKKYVVDLSDIVMSYKDKNSGVLNIDIRVPGFPTMLKCYLNDDRWGGDTIVEFYTLQVGYDFNHLTTLWDGTIYMNCTNKQKEAHVTPTGNWSNDDKYAKITERTDNWNFPAPNRVSWNEPAVSVNVPKEGTNTVGTGSAAVYDQYGVEWKDEPSYSLKADSSGKTLTGISCAAGPADKTTVSVNNGAKDYVGAGTASRKVYLYASCGSAKSSAKEINVYNFTYTVTLKNGSEVYSTLTPVYGGRPTAEGTPTKNADVQYTYSFEGWTAAADGSGAVYSNSNLPSAYSDAVYYAKYKATIRSYTVTFRNYDGSVIESKAWNYGTTPSCSKTPARSSTAEFTYKFTGWSPEITAVGGDKTYTAQYSATKNKYTVTFKNGDGTDLQSSMWEYGAMPSCDAVPTKNADGMYTYTFSGWTPAVVRVTGNAVYTPQFSRTPIIYTVSFNAGGGSGSMDSITADCEYPLILPANTFVKTGYTFTGWATTANGSVQYPDRGNIMKIAGNITLYAVWEANTYKINTVLHNIEGAKVITAEYDQDVSIPDPVKKGFIFNGWADSENGTIRFTPGAKVRNLSAEGEVTLHAVWTFDTSKAGTELTEQSIVLDFGLPVQYDIKKNNKPNGAKTEYLGTADKAGEISFSEPAHGGFSKNAAHGVFTLTSDGNVTYEIYDMNFTHSDTVYVLVRITDDSAYEKGTVYYAYEKITFVPASNIYYEDDFKENTVITYIDGTGSSYGKWTTEGQKLQDMKQAADLAGDPAANEYGHDDAYKGSTYSAGSAHFVQVSEKNNPHKYKGKASWPAAKFTFTGTGFDIISLTDSRTGAVEVKVYDSSKKLVKDYITDTFYGYKYGRIYKDAGGNPTFSTDGKPMYKSLVCDAFSETPSYYVSENDKTLTAEKTPYPAFAYGWMLNPDKTEVLYQIPVIKSDKLPYGTYTVEIIPTFTKMFGHSDMDASGEHYYGFFLDAVRIYNPASPTDKQAQEAYNKDKEANPEYMEVRDLIIEANSFGNATSDGMLFLDGTAACNDIEMYKNAGPKNELYLKKGQAIAFNLTADYIPSDVQIGAKLIKGEPALTVTSGNSAGTQNIVSATDMYYSFGKILSSGLLSWTKTAEGKYITDTITIQNNSSADSVLSLTNIKWTYTTPEARPMMMRAMVSPMTANAAAESMNMLKADLTVNNSAEPTIENGNAIFILKTSSDVSSLILKDEQGNEIIPVSIEYTVETEYKEWKLTLDASAPGSFTYEVCGAYENGYTDSEKAQKISFTVKKPAENSGNNMSFIEFLLDILRRIKAYFMKLYEIFNFVC